MTRDELVRLRLRMPAETVATIAASVGLSGAQLTKRWARAGIIDEYPMVRPHRWTRPYAVSLHRRWCANETLADLEASEGIHRSAIWHAFRRFGLRLPDHIARQGRGKMSAARKTAEKAVV